MATTLLNSTKKPAKKPLFVHHQSAILTKSKLNFIRKERKRIEDRCSSHIFATQHLNTFDDTLRLNGYPENSIEQTKRPQNPQRNPQPAHTLNGHTLRSRTFLNDSITESLPFLEKKTPLYALPTNPTLSGKPYRTPSRSANALETNALSLTPDCVYEEMQCSSSRVTAAISNTSVARHTSSMTS